MGATGEHAEVEIDEGLVRALTQDLTAAGFSVDGVDSLLGPMAAGALRRDEIAAARWTLERQPPGPLALLVRLFLFGDWCLAEDVDEALPQCRTSGLARLGLVEVATTDAVAEVHAAFDLRPYRQSDQAADWWVVSDLGEENTGSVLDLEHVIGIGQASLLLAQATVPRPVQAALDLGTGCGVQALHLRTHAASVTATDLSERARQVARLTFALNGLTDIEVLGGDLLTPVAGRSFDLVVSNPPFVITPRDRKVPTYTYRDAGRVGDRLVSDLIADVGEVLAPGGLAQMLGNWEIRDGRSWTERVGGWLERATGPDGGPLDAWIIQRDVLDPAQYAQLWARDGGVQSARSHEALVRAWLDDLAGREVTAVGMGLILLRRPGPGTRPLRYLEEVLSPIRGPLGAHLDACWQAHDRLPATDAGLLDTRLTVGDVIEQRDHLPGAGDPTGILLRQNDGFGRQVRVDTALAAVVGACDGTLTLGQITGAVADLLDLSGPELDATVPSAVRDLVIQGFLGVAASSAESSGQPPTPGVGTTPR